MSWQAEHRLVRVALKGRAMPTGERPAARLVFLVDTSGSMAQPNKLPLVQQSLQLLFTQLAPTDRVALVSYAGESRIVLASTPVSERAVIESAVKSLSPSGGTNGSDGIKAAYGLARSNFLPGGVNRVILATDGDFNIGVTSQEELKSLITREAKSGVYLSVLGYGSDNLKDTTAELLADAGNGNYAYIDSLSEARRALVGQLSGTLITIAKDIKIQVEFNPAQVASYRLLGYENRALANQDFNDDTKDAGEIGAGHSVTALYEIIPSGLTSPAVTTIDPLKYQTATPASPPVATLSPLASTGELLTVKLRYQQPEGTAPSQLIEVAVKDPGTAWAEASANFRWTVAEAGYGLLLQDSVHAQNLAWETIRSLQRLQRNRPGWLPRGIPPTNRKSRWSCSYNENTLIPNRFQDEPTENARSKQGLATGGGCLTLTVNWNEYPVFKEMRPSFAVTTPSRKLVIVRLRPAPALEPSRSGCRAGKSPKRPPLQPVPRPPRRTRPHPPPL